VKALQSTIRLLKMYKILSRMYCIGHMSLVSMSLSSVDVDFQLKQEVRVRHI